MSKRAMFLTVGVVLASVTAAQWAQTDEPGARRAMRESRAERREGPGNGPGAQAVTSEQETKALAALKKYRPLYHQRLMTLKASNPGIYRRYLAWVWQWYQDIENMPEKVRQAVSAKQDAEVRIGQILREYRDSSSDSERAELKSKLRAVMAEHFDAEQVEREWRLSQLEDRIKRLRAELKERIERREKIIDVRVAQWLEQEGRPLHRPRPLGPGPVDPE
ncbi:MAG TPA: hypothetical protein DCX07_13855 [Phycisphaerales bacterium]|nr:hypothetical protein [Phycisphaerales bacterium]